MLDISGKKVWGKKRLDIWPRGTRDCVYVVIWELNLYGELHVLCLAFSCLYDCR